MNIYLPIAEMSVNIFLFLGMGAALGGVTALGGWAFWQGCGQSPLLLSARNDDAGRQSRATTKTPMPARA